MKVSLWKDIRAYSKTKGKIPFDERQINAQKDIYTELAKSVIIGFMFCIFAFGYMDVYDHTSQYNMMTIGICVLGTICYYYVLRFCYCGVIGLDATFEVILAPAFMFSPITIFYGFAIIFDTLQLPNICYFVLTCFIPIFFILIYLGANKVYKNGKIRQEKMIENGELHFHSRKILVLIFIFATIFAFMLPIPYDLVFSIFIVLASLFIVYSVYYLGFTSLSNDYILNAEGVFFRKTLWGKKGKFIPYADIKTVSIQDTFNIGYAKDKVRIECHDGTSISLFPENAYLFHSEIINNM